MPKAMPKPDTTDAVRHPELTEASIDLPHGAVGSPAIDLQRLLVARFSESGRLSTQTLPAQSDAARILDDMVSAGSRLAGPVLFIAALAGLAFLLL